ncbi:MULTISPECIES: CitMHS family transporter [Actinopolyspora]|uniref:Citrate-Mg2+:H+ or citrate-Ca2+:H+ symporter, CitMHS family n=1 Tax=Actinopolyspora saharensis TaxID=995062 RepID=A0A1H0YNT1_9ACTN|nr:MULTISPECIES: citrate:proton symporter [Actinopolyspora]SDQ16813.1 citrate-Mg2+:H+ or citrate-Ca2+:H+ symporter, CitMHS family [Actinopolyspora saharensis]
MLTALGFAAIIAILLLLITSRVAAVAALIGVPVVAALLAGSSPTEIGEMISAGIDDIVGVVAMFVFAILFFGVLRDAGMFDPIVRRVLQYAGSNPVTIAVGTALLALVCHLDGAGATTFVITLSALLPLYDAMGMSRLVLATVTGLAAGAVNMVPWSGPTARASSVVNVEANALWTPLLPAQLTGVAAVLGVAAWLGRRERRRLAASAESPPRLTRGDRLRAATASDTAADPAVIGADDGAGPARDESAAMTVSSDVRLIRPRLFWVNLVLAAVTVGTLISGIAQPAAVFMVALVLALVVNYPGMRRQNARIDAHAQSAVLMATTLLAAGAFLGIMEETGMIRAMATALAEGVPPQLGPLLPLLVGVFAVPMSFLFGPDPYYFGVLPVLIGVGEQFGVAPQDLAQASILGEETLGFPLTPMTGSFFLLVGLARVDIGRHIRHMAPWAWGISLLTLVVAVATGVVPVWAG